MKLTVTLLVKKLNVSYGTRQFISLLTAVLPSLCPEDGCIPPVYQNTRHDIIEDSYLNTLHWLEVKSDM